MIRLYCILKCQMRFCYKELKRGLLKFMNKRSKLSSVLTQWEKLNQAQQSSFQWDLVKNNINQLIKTFKLKRTLLRTCLNSHIWMKTSEESSFKIIFKNLSETNLQERRYYVWKRWCQKILTPQLTPLKISQVWAKSK